MTVRESTRTSQSCEPPKLVRRKLDWDFPPSIPANWFGGSAALTALLDTFTVVIPDNERYYVRTLRAEVRGAADACVRDEMLAFFQQETLHGNAHRKYWANLRDGGVHADRFARAVDAVLYGCVERILPHRLNVANVAAIEHVNAYLAHAFLRRGTLRHADPAMRRLFEWHFAEEIEHKGVAFDALARAYPGYATRALSGVLVFTLFHALLALGTGYVLLRRRELFRRRTMADLWRFWIREGFLAESLRAMGRYFAPGFHPWRVDDYALAEPVLRAMTHEVMPPLAPDAAESPP